MMRTLIVTFLVFFLGHGNFWAQPAIDNQNCRQGESIEYCLQHKQLAKLLENPEFKKQWDKDQAQLKSEEALLIGKAKGSIPAKGLIYRIPVVFHILHNGGTENISKAQIDNALAILNRDFRRQNADAATVNTPFLGMPADIEIEFVYATKAPNGQCFTGITRTRSEMTSDGSDGSGQVNAIVAGNDIYNGQWPGNKYLNVFVCQNIGGAAGYTYNPNNWIGTNMRNGIWILHNYVGSFGTSSENRSRTLTHEVGHWLNLAHVWGGTNNPGLSSNCSSTSDDDIDDTPETIGNTFCQLNLNTCNLDFNYWGFDQVDPVENYMNYSYCSKMYTPGQATRMRTAITSNVGGRSNVISPANLIATGADSNLYICEANFSSSVQFLCSGDSIQFFDESFNNVKGWSWSFPGGTPSTSTEQNPYVTYSSLGTYSVTLVATDSVTNQSVTKSNYIHVLPSGITLPYSESFESYSSLVQPNSFWRATGTGAQSFEVTGAAGSHGTKSLRLRNYNLAPGTFSELYSDPFDLSGLTSTDQVTFSFKYAHRRKTSDNFEIFRMHATTDCGATWSIRSTLLSSSLSTQSETSEWIPGPNDWVQVHVTNINSNYFTDNMQLKYSFESDGGNDLYIDEINLYQGGPSALEISEIDQLENIRVYPNPAEDELNVQFYTSSNKEVVLEIQDITGKRIQAEWIQATLGNNLVLMNTSTLASGVYFMNVLSNNTSRTIQFIVK